MLEKLKFKMLMWKIKFTIWLQVSLIIPPNITCFQYLGIVVLWYLTLVTEDVNQLVVISVLLLWTFFSKHLNKWLLKKIQANKGDSQ